MLEEAEDWDEEADSPDDEDLDEEAE